MRPKKCRHVSMRPTVTVYKPAGIPARELQEITLHLDELEAMRLADVENLYHVDAAEKMMLSRSTFARLLKAGRKKVADALCSGKTIAIDHQGVIQIAE
jgi:uncharacterized protein